MIPLTAWEVVRCLFSLVCYTVLPGLIITHFIDRKRKLWSPGAASKWVGWSLVANAVLVYSIRFAQGSLDHYTAALIVFDIIGAVLISVRLWDRELHRSRLKLNAIVYPGLVLLISLLWFGAILRTGPRIDYHHDQWFHIAHVREAVESNSLFPSNPFWSDRPLSDVYGVWHALLAAVARSARIDTLVLWRVGNAYMAALGFVVVCSTATAFFSETALRLVAGIVFLGTGVDASLTMFTFIYPWGISYLLMWISLGMLFQYLVDADREKAALATAAGLTPLLIHPQEFIFLCFGVFVLGLSAMLMKQTFSINPKEIRRIWLFLALITLLGSPILLLKHPQRMLTTMKEPTTRPSPNSELALYHHPLTKLLAEAFPYHQKIPSLKYTLFPFKFISLLILFLLPGHLGKRVHWFTITLAWAPTLAAILPGLSWLTQLVLKEAYSWRLVSLVPSHLIWTSIIASGVSVKILGRRPRDRAEMRFARSLGWWYFALIGTLVGGVGLSILHLVRYDQLNATASTPLQSQPMLDQLDELMPDPVIVLSDPTTSYVIPAFTKHRVVLNEPAHGGRDDLTTRFIETRELMSSPYQSSDEAIATLRKYDLRLIVVDKSSLDKVFYLQTPFYSDYTLEFLAENPRCFQSVYDDAGFAVFRFLDCEPDDLLGKGLDQPSAASVQDVQYIVRRDFTTELSLLGYSLSDNDGVSVGHSLMVDLYWEANEDIRDPYAVWLELLCDYPGRSHPFGKALRRANGITASSVFQVGSAAWMPIPPEGLKSPDLHRQAFTLEIPSNLTQGPCDLNVYVLDRRQALYDRAPLPDWCMEHEYTLPGVRLGSVDINR